MRLVGIPLGCIVVLMCTARIANADPQGGGFEIVRDGRPQATIVIAADAGQKVKLAAEELQSYIRKISGVTLPMVTDSDDPEGRLILVGKSKLTQAIDVAIPAGLTGARREEGFVIFCDGNHLLLAGNDAGPYHGTEYAVYDFLERLGVRWFMPGDFGEIVPSMSTIVFPRMEVRQKPDFIMRNWWCHVPEALRSDDERWKIRNKMNPEPPFKIPSDSSVRDYIQDWKNITERPELFALSQYGERQKGLPCLTNPKAVKEVAEGIKAYLRKHEDEDSCAFAPDDGFPRDFTPETMELNQGFVELGGRPGVPGEVSISEEWFAFVNKVIEEVHKEFPNAYIATNGYANRDIPPQGLKLNDHLVLMFAAIWSCTIHSHDDPHCWQKELQGKLIEQWTKLCPNVWIYGYIDNMLVSGLTPFAEVHKIRRDIPLYKKWGVIGFWDEARNVWAESGIVSRVVRAKLEWDADADVDAILDDFYSKWYGPAAKPARAFYDALDNAFANTRIHGHEDRVLPEIYTPALMRTLAKHLAEAERAAFAVDPYRTRVAIDRLIYEHLSAYMAMTQAEWSGNFANAAAHAQRMLDLRKELHAINPFLMPAGDEQYAYWGVTKRKDYYQMFADLTSGKTGDMVALLPERAMLRIDPHDEGVFYVWYNPDFEEREWKSVLTTRPFYMQGYMDERGHPYTGHLWYRLKVDVPASAAGRKIMLCAPVVESEAWAWVNGSYVGHRKYQDAYERPCEMILDVTDAIKPGETNTVAIRVHTGLAPAQAASGLLSRLFLYSPKEQQ